MGAKFEIICGSRDFLTGLVVSQISEESVDNDQMWHSKGVSY